MICWVGGSQVLHKTVVGGSVQKLPESSIRCCAGHRESSNSEPSVPRRALLSSVAVSSVAMAVMAMSSSGVALAQGNPSVKHTEEEWRSLLSPLAYKVLRENGTERSFTSTLNNENRAGIFACAGCSANLFSSKAKFDSGTGWPSFYEPVSKEAIQLRQTPRDAFFMMKEVRCATCDSHQGHVFHDAPSTPTGDRYCINGVALKFIPD